MSVFVHYTCVCACILWLIIRFYSNICQFLSCLFWSDTVVVFTLINTLRPLPVIRPVSFQFLVCLSSACRLSVCLSVCLCDPQPCMMRPSVCRTVWRICTSQSGLARRRWIPSQRWERLAQLVCVIYGNSGWMTDYLFLCERGVQNFRGWIKSIIENVEMNMRTSDQFYWLFE